MAGTDDHIGTTRPDLRANDFPPATRPIARARWCMDMIDAIVVSGYQLDRHECESFIDMVFELDRLASDLLQNEAQLAPTFRDQLVRHRDAFDTTARAVLSRAHNSSEGH